jgi:predicted Zn-dependent protease
MRVILFVACLSLCSCNLPDNYQLQIDPSGFSSEEVDVILTAAQNWENAVPVHFSTSIESCRGFEDVICVRAGESAGVSSASNYLGSTYEEYILYEDFHHSQITLYLNDIYDNPNPSSVLLEASEHELGHAMGLVHHQIKGVLMYPNITGGSNGKITEDDIAQFMHYRDRPF